jgi:hypothetical protein
MNRCDMHLEWRISPIFSKRQDLHESARLQTDDAMMARLFLCIGASALLAAFPLTSVHAEPATAARCRALLASVPLVTGRPATAEPQGREGCRFTMVEFGAGSRFSYQVGSLIENGIPSEPLKVPRHLVSVRIEARDIVFLLHTGNVKVDWLNRQQQVPFDIVLDGRYDPANGVVTIRELSLEGRAVGRTTLAGVLSHVSETGSLDVAAMQSFALHLDSQRFIVNFVLPFLLDVLPDENPGGAVDYGKAQAVATIRALLPQVGASEQTVGAVTGFIADFPNPQHVLDFAVTAAKPVTVTALEDAAGDPATATALLRTLTVTASYTGEPR